MRQLPVCRRDPCVVSRDVGAQSEQLFRDAYRRGPTRGVARPDVGVDIQRLSDLGRFEFRGPVVVLHRRPIARHARARRVSGLRLLLDQEDRGAEFACAQGRGLADTPGAAS